MRQIQIKGTKAKAFEFLIRFLFTGKVPEELEPRIYSDVLEDKDDASPEDMFLAANPYNKKALQRQTLESLLPVLTPARSRSC